MGQVMALETWHAYFLGPGVPGRQVLICPVGEGRWEGLGVLHPAARL